MTNNKELLELALATYGRVPQLLMVLEEMSELSVKILHVLRGRSPLAGGEVLEEIADVEIMMEQLRIMIDAEGGTVALDERKEEKLQRLASRLAKEKKHD